MCTCVCLVVSDSATPWTEPVWLLCPWGFPGKNTGVSSHSLLQGIFPNRNQTQISCTAVGFFTREAWPTCRLKNSPKKSHVTAIWSPSWEKVLGSTSTPWIRPQIAVSGAPTYNPRLQTDIIRLHAKIHLWFYFNIVTMLFVLYCESGFCQTLLQLVKPPGTQEFQDPLPFLSEVLPDSLFLQASTEFGQCPGRLEAKSGACYPASEAWTRLPAC